MSIPLLLLLTLGVLLSSPAIAQQLAEDLTITSVQGNGDCLNTGLVALNCSSPFTLTVSVERIVDLPLPPYSFYLDADDGSWTFWYSPNAGNATATSIAFTVSTPPFQLTSGLLLNVALVDVRNYSAVVRSPPTAGFSLAYVSLPKVTAVSGCLPTANPLLTTGCRPDVDVLTLAGTGFSGLSIVQLTLTQPGYRVSSQTMVLDTRYGSLVLVNDSTLLLPLTGLQFLNQAAHFDGRILSMFFGLNLRFQSSQWNVSMAYLPPPVITAYSVYGQQPVVVANVSTYPQCVPGVDALFLSGRWLFWSSITVGGAQCNNRINAVSGYIDTPTQLGCVLPIVEPDVTVAMYDVVFNSVLGTVLTLPAVIGYTALPSIASVSACWSDGGFYNSNVPPLRCLAGDIITVYGRRFLAANLTLTNVTMLPWWTSPTAPLVCSNLSVLNDSALTCVLPPSSDGMAPWYLQTTWNGNYTSNQLSVSLYDYPDSPRILSVSGCGQSSNLSTGLSLSGCQQGEVITLSGFNLAAASALFDVVALSTARTNYGSFFCAPLIVLSNATATCQLPTASEFSWPVWYAPYKLSMMQQGYGLISNYFSISFAPPCNTSCSASSSSSSSSLSAPSPTSSFSSSSASSSASSSTSFPASSSSSTSSSPASPSFRASSSSSSFSSPSSSSSSAGAKEGGGSSSRDATVAAVASVLSALALLLLLGAGCWLWRRRLQRGDGKAGSSWSSDDSSEAMAAGSNWQSFDSVANSTADIELADG